MEMGEILALHIIFICLIYNELKTEPGGLIMNCHEENKEKQISHKHSPLKHMLHMVVCCGLPIIIIGALPAIARLSPAAGEILGKLAPFLCPIMMLLMLPMMFRANKNGSCCGDERQPDKPGRENDGGHQA